MNRNHRINSTWIAYCGILLALEILFLVFSFLQIELGAFTIVFSALPIAVAAITLGYRASLLLGIAWGIISFSQAFSDSFGLVMLETNPVGTFVVLGLSRVLVGICNSITYNVISNSKHLKKYNVIATCFMSSVFNNLFFMGGLAIFFQDTFIEYIYPILGASFVFNMLPETIACVALGTLIVMAIRKSRNWGEMR